VSESTGEKLNNGNPTHERGQEKGSRLRFGLPGPGCRALEIGNQNRG